MHANARPGTSRTRNANQPATDMWNEQLFRNRAGLRTIASDRVIVFHPLNFKPEPVKTTTTLRPSRVSSAARSSRAVSPRAEVGST